MSEHVPDSVTTADLSGVPVIGVTGELDEYNIDPVRFELNTQLDRRPAALVLDLCDVTFFGSAGLALIVETHQRATEQDAIFAVVARQRVVLRPMQVTGVDRLIDVHEELAGAMAAVQSMLVN